MGKRIRAATVAVVSLVASIGWVAMPSGAPTASAASTEALLIGDSVMNGMAQTYSAAARALLAARHSYILDAAGCRRLITTSCRILPSPAPTNAITVLRARAGQFRRVLVIAAGYNDTTTGAAGVSSAVDVMMAEARRQGVPYVIWLTYREAGPSAPRFRAHNAVLRAKTGQYANLRIADWNLRSLAMPTSWFSADGIHLGGQAASGMADLIADTIDLLPPATPPPPPPPTRCDAPAWLGALPATGPVVSGTVSGGVHLLDVPQRVLNTRPLTGTLGAGRMMTVPVAGQNGVAADATAALVNVTAVRPCLGTSVTAYPCGGAVPLASMLNAPAGATVANSAVVPLGEGSLCVYTAFATDVLVDITGWIGPGGDLTTVVDPTRVLDTRAGQTEASAAPQVRLAADQFLTVDLRGTVPSIDSVATGVTAVSLGIAALAPAAGPTSVTGFVSVLPGACGVTTPATSPPTWPSTSSPCTAPPGRRSRWSRRCAWPTLGRPRWCPARRCTSTSPRRPVGSPPVHPQGSPVWCSTWWQ